MPSPRGSRFQLRARPSSTLACAPQAGPHLQPEPKAFHNLCGFGLGLHGVPGKREHGAGVSPGNRGVPPRTRRVGSASVTALVRLSAGRGNLSGDPSIWGSGEARGGLGGVFREGQGRELKLSQVPEQAPPPGQERERGRGAGDRPRAGPSPHILHHPAPWGQPLCTSGPEPVLTQAQGPRASREDPAESGHG